MEFAIEKLEKAYKKELSYEEASLNFQKIYTSNSQNWYAAYYSAYCLILEASELEGDKKTDELLDTAESYIQKANKIKQQENNPETDILQAFIYQLRINVNPMFRGLKYSSKAEELLMSIREEFPYNPRTDFLLGMQYYHMPAILGGGVDKAKPYFESAQRKFNSEEVKDVYAPHWGTEKNQEMLEKCE